MSDLTTKFAALSEQLAAQATASDALVDTVEAKLQALFDEIDTIIVNNAANTRAILLALGSLDPCACAGTPTLIVPPIGTTPIGVSSEQCQRIQAFLHTMQEIFTVLDVASAFSVGLNFSLVSNSINEVITSIESGSDLPVISYPEANLLINDVINYIIGNLLVGGTLSGYFSSVLFDLRDGMALSNSASSAKSFYDGVINASGLPSYVKPVIKDAAYGALYSYYFDPGTAPNLTGYDGSLCMGCLTGITGCTSFDAAPATASGASWYAVIACDLLGGAGHEFLFVGDYFHYTIQRTTGTAGRATQVRYHDATHDNALISLLDNGSDVTVINVHTQALAIYTLDHDANAHPFTVIICPP